MVAGAVDSRAGGFSPLSHAVYPDIQQPLHREELIKAHADAVYHSVLLRERLRLHLQDLLGKPRTIKAELTCGDNRLVEEDSLQLPRGPCRPHALAGVTNSRVGIEA